MKKTLVTIALSSIVAASTYAQGLVVFNNTSTTKISTNSVAGGAATGTTVATAGAFYYALFFSATATTVNGSASAVAPTATAIGTYVTSDGNWTANGILGSSSASTGRFASTSPNGDGSTTVTGLAAGATGNFVVLGWSANIGTTLSDLTAWLAAPTFQAGQTYYVGESIVGTQTAGNGGSIPNPGLFGTVSPGISGFTLGAVAAPIPEPGTMALAALGGASLLLFRRKK